MHHSRLPSFAFALAILTSPLFAGIAHADDEDKAACEGKEEGDACTRGDGDGGTCVPDDSDPVLTCEDSIGDSTNISSAGNSSSSSSGNDDDDDNGCKIGGDGADGVSFAAFALAGFLGLRRRRRVG
jgi:MYXO-CTERM domain-containing protein